MPLTLRGGKVVGTPIEKTRCPILLNRSTHVLPRNVLEDGINISCVWGTRSINPKIPCLPGLQPVAIDAHAVDDTVGSTDVIDISDP